MRPKNVVFSMCVLVLSACDPSKAPPRVPAAIVATRQALSPNETTNAPIVSPDHSVRRANPDEVSSGRAPLKSECEGDACGVVQVAWLDPGYRFTNTGTRDVSIRIWFAANGECLLSQFSIAPTKSSGWGNTGFCKPYRATYK